MALGQVADSNAIFLKSKGRWEYPVEYITGVDYYDKRKHIADSGPNNYDVTFFSDSPRVVHSVFDGRVILVNPYDDVFMVVVKYGDYFLSYTNLLNPLVKKGDTVKANQPIASMGLDLDGKFAVEMQLSGSIKSNIDIFPWFKKSIH